MLERVTKTQASHISAAILCKLYNLHSKSVSGKNCKCKLGKTQLKEKQDFKIKVSPLLQSTLVIQSDPN